jgi:hypothetical protein
VAPAHHVPAHGVPTPQEIAHALLGFVGDLDGRELAGAEQPHQLPGVPPVGLDPLPPQSGPDGSAPAVRALPADARREHAGLDGREDRGDQPNEPAVAGAVPRGPVAVELRLRGLRDHVEAELEILLVGQTVHGYLDSLMCQWRGHHRQVHFKG